MRKSLVRLLVLSSMSVGLAACGGEAESPAPDSLGWQTEEPGEIDDTVDEDEGPEVTDPDPDPTGTAPDGAACDADAECAGGVCLQGADWPDGYCTHTACEGTCEDPNAGCIDSGLGNFCAETCASDDDCRTGYACAFEAGSAKKVCVPPVGLPDGSPCESDYECQGGTCITDWPGGFCTTVGCDNFEDCARQGNENRCLRRRGPDVCVRICTETSECRDGYVCEMFGNGEGMCAPDPATPLDPTVLEGNPFDLTCTTSANGTVSIDYDIAADTVAYMVTPLTRDGRQIAPNEIGLPGGTALDFRGPNAFQSVPAQLYGGMNPTVVPATKQFANQLEPGAHSYDLDTGSTEVCHYILEESTLGDTIDFNIYLVDVPGIDAATAETNPDMEVVLQQFDDIYAAAGVSIGKVRYFDITGDDAARYSILRSDTAVSELVQLSERPGPEMDDVLSINIFFVRAFAMGGAIGISLGLPGPAGLHGSHGSGVAFTSEYLGQDVEPSLGEGGMVDGNIFTGQILAHEIGHYIGLFHTSEQGGYSFDPLPDTPQCGRISLDCPDINNLMFPFAGESHTEVTADQQWVIQVNPLTKEGPDSGTDATDATDPNDTNDPADPMGGN